jgi:sugar phosphate isomerase/epimerase
MKLGAGSYCWMWAIGVPGQPPPASPLDAFALLDRCHQLGLRVVQFGPNLPLPLDRLPHLAERARELGIEVEVGIAGLDPTAIRQGVDLCRHLRASLLRTVDLYEGPTRATADLEASLRAALPLLEASNVRLAVENARTPARDLAASLDAIASPWLGVTLDTVNSLAVPEGTVEVVDALARHTLCLHVKDFRVRRIWHMMGFTVEGTPAGQGQLDIPWLLDRIRAEGRHPNAILELWVPQQDSLEQTIALEQSWVNESIAYLRRFLKD